MAPLLSPEIQLPTSTNSSQTDRPSYSGRNRFPPNGAGGDSRDKELRVKEDGKMENERR